jgi:hypothetical protein
VHEKKKLLLSKKIKKDFFIHETNKIFSPFLFIFIFIFPVWIYANLTYNLNFFSSNMCCNWSEETAKSNKISAFRYQQKSQTNKFNFIERLWWDNVLQHKERSFFYIFEWKVLKCHWLWWIKSFFIALNFKIFWIA